MFRVLDFMPHLAAAWPVLELGVRRTTRPAPTLPSGQS